MDSEYEERQQYYTLNPIPYVLKFLALYGWYVIFGTGALLYFVRWVRPHIEDIRMGKKDEEETLRVMQAVERARQLQQERLLAESQRAVERQKELEERKRQETAERLQKYSGAGGQRLGALDDDYMPLSGGASCSSYRPPKRSKCGGGGCGR